MRKILHIAFVFFCITSYSQTITVDNTTNSPTQLVDLLLGNSCVEVSNIAISSDQSVGYFNQNSSTFPLSEGIIIRNGIATHTQGSYTGANLSSTASGGGTDPFLQNLSNISSGQTTPIVDLAYLQFDFVPVSSSFSFDFLFASNEYGQFQCISNDIFAFELTDLTTGNTTNLAVIPGTSNPVTVKNIKNSLYNSTCGSTNPGLFSVYNVNNPAASTLNMRGHTVVLNAASAVLPGNPYRLKLVIADYGDFEYDSAVFIAAGSFENNFSLGPDRSICSGDAILLETHLDSSYSFQWFLNGVPIPGETNPTYTAIQAGIYTVEITKGSCLLTDTVVFSTLSVTAPLDLQTCDTGSAAYDFDLTTNSATQLGIDPANYSVFYYASVADIAANNPIPTGDLANYSSPGSQTILIRIFNNETSNFCDAVYSFDLIVNNAVTAGSNIIMHTCDTGDSYNLLNINLPVLDGQPAADYIITYYATQSDAQQGINGIGNMLPIPSGSTSVTIWAQMQDINNPDCFAVTNAVITVHPLPVVDSLPNVIECSAYTLPVITNGSYYDGPNGTGDPLFPGDTIDESGVYYIFVGPDANGCTNESSFEVFLVEQYRPDRDHCGRFIVPSIPYNVGAFYTAPGGPSGSGSVIPAGQQFLNETLSTTTVDLYYYAEVNGSVCVDVLFVIYIHPLPLVDDPADVTTCNSYTLPPLTHGSYFTLPGGPGTLGQTPLPVGRNITASQTIYVYNQLAFVDVDGRPGFCSRENSMTINIVNTAGFGAVVACGSFTLPAITFGGYYTAPMGGGSAVNPADPITTSQVIYYYAATSDFPNCTNNLNYAITIHPLPLVDTVASGTHCGEFILPTLTNGSYFTIQGGPTAAGQIPLPAGSIIDLSGLYLSPGTYWIYSGPNAQGCSNETSFTIGLTPFPLTDEPINRTECQPYSIPQPANGTVYDAPGGPSGAGSVVDPTRVFNQDNTFYIYNIDPVTGCVFDKSFEITYNGINLPDFPDQNVCDSYTLPALTHVPPEPTTSYSVGYFYDPSGVNPVPPGTVFTSLNTPDTIYVYAVNAGRLAQTCIEEQSFEITVSDTPILPPLIFDAEECGSYTLPPLPTVSYTINYYSQRDGVGLISPSAYTYSTPGTYTVYVYATAPNNIACFDETQFTFTVYPLLDIVIPGGIICVDPLTNQTLRPHTIHTNLSPSLYTVDWYLNGTLVGTGPSYTATQEGIYDVRFTKLTPDIGANCNFKDTQVVVTKSSAAIASLSLSGAFEDQIDITVNVTGGYGDYLYVLNNGTAQTSNVFTDVPAGEHIITVIDTKANCAQSFLKAIVLHYPKFFTPNGDNYNDRWNITDLEEQPDALINIYDRYGKFVKQISPAGPGWDGTFNGKPLPATDYWFQVFYKLNNEDREFRAHFSLKR